MVIICNQEKNYHSADKRDRDLYPSPECSKVAVGSLTITELCYLTKTASAIILNSNKTRLKSYIVTLIKFY